MGNLRNAASGRAMDEELLRARWAGLTFDNDYVFGAVLKTNLELCRRLLVSVLEVPIGQVELVTPQREISPSQRAKSVRLDAYAEDGSGRIFDIEMQRNNEIWLPKRARYYQSAMDTEQLDKGVGYEDLPATYVIFFCTFDPFGRGLKKYTYRQACVEDGSFDPWDGATRIFLNARGTLGEVNSDLQGVLDYLAGHNEREGELVRDIESTVQQVLSSDARRSEFMKYEADLMDARRHGRVEGREQGLAEGESGAYAKLDQLAEELFKQGRADELTLALRDAEARDRLYQEFGIK